jgi:metallopeptidase MepB
MSANLNSRRTPPQPPPTFDGLTPESVEAETQSILSTRSTLLGELAKTLSPSTATFTNLVRPLIDNANRAAGRLFIFRTLLASVSPDSALRDASRKAEKQIEAAEAANLMCREIAELIAAVFGNSQNDDSLDAQDRYLLARMHGEYVRAGARIHDSAQRERFQAALLELNEVRVAAQKAFTEADDGAWFSRAELKGVPDDKLTTMETVKGKGSNETEDALKVTFRNGHFRDVMRHALSGETRKKLYVAKQHRFPENVERLSTMVVLRDEIARLLGFENHAVLKIEEKMAKSVGGVRESLHEIKRRLAPIAKAETERLLLLKKNDIQARRDAGTSTDLEDVSKLYIWDWGYYFHIQKEKTYSIDTAKLAEYFEVTNTVKRILGVFELLFGIEFEQIEASVWHEDVKAYSAWDGPTEGGLFLGYLYLDLFGRQGKYRGGHNLAITQVSSLLSSSIFNLFWLDIDHLPRASSKQTVLNIIQCVDWHAVSPSPHLPDQLYFNTKRS